FMKAARGGIPLVITVYHSDTMASLLRLKKEVETAVGAGSIKMVFAGAVEAHLIAEEIVEAGVGVILTMPRCSPAEWDYMRCLDAPPLSPNSLPVELTLKNATVAFGAYMWNWKARHQYYEAAWAYKTSAGRISKAQAVAWAA
ncbi:hypothetical protein BT69DRAFT_1194886, partial [Atractiella rhizophila]